MYVKMDFCGNVNTHTSAICPFSVNSKLPEKREKLAEEIFMTC